MRISDWIQTCALPILGAPGADLRQRPVVVDHHHVAAEHEVRLAGGDAHGVDVGGRTRNTNMRGDRAALLRQAGLVAHGRAAALPVPGESDERRVGKEYVRKCRSMWTPTH